MVPVNADQLAAQGAAAAGTVGKPVVTHAPALAGTRPVEKAAWQDAKGQAVVERWLVQDLGPAWPGGDAAGTHVDTVGPSASEAFWAFFRGRKL